VGLDEHMNNEVSSETGNFTCEELANIYNEIFAYIKTEEKKYVGSVLKFEDKSDEEDLEATLIYMLGEIILKSPYSTSSCNTLSIITTNLTAVTNIGLHILI
jgi:Uma2 family endonuclease